MMIQNIILANESYTHNNWVYENISVGFSRLYYILDGEAYYKEGEKCVRLQKNHLYLTPVKKPITFYENPQDKLLHTYAHIFTAPAVSEFTEIEVKEGTALADAVALWRKYIHTDDGELLMNVTQLVVSCIDRHAKQQNALCDQIKDYLDGYTKWHLDMEEMSRTLGYTREHVTRSFSLAYGTTPKQYFNVRRMQTALSRLLEGSRVGEVATELQFASPYSFSKAFKAHYGMSPRRYLQTFRAREASPKERF